MRKFFIYLILVFSSLLLTFGCGKEKERTMIHLPSSTDQSPTPMQEEMTEQKERTSSPSSEGMVRSPLTNLWVSEQTASLRPLAVMIPNDASALPHYNISNADILYECLVEGNMTRLMGIFGDWTSLERLGNIRSCRDYFVYWAFEWDAIYVHAGGPFYIKDVISRSDTQNIDALTAPEGVFYRTTDRSAPQNLYFDGSALYKEAERLNYSLQPRIGYSDTAHFQFSSDSNSMDKYPNAAAALQIDLSNAYPITQTQFKYQKEDGLYYRYQSPSGGAHIDAATGEQLSFKNILLQFAYYEVRDDQGYLAFQCIDSRRDGWYFTEGKGIHVNWEKTSDYGPTRYYDDQGNEIFLNEGKTMICIIPEGSTFAFHNK